MAAYREGGKFLTKRQQSRSKRKFVLSSHRKHWSVANTKLKQARGLIISCKNSKKKKMPKRNLKMRRIGRTALSREWY